MRWGRLLRLVDFAGFLDILARIKCRNSLLIVMYHEVGNRSIYYDVSVPSEYFEQQVQYLLRIGFKLMPLCEAIESLRGERKFLSKVAVLTFDDGYKGVYESALPIMKKYGVRGTVYVSSGFVENKIPHWSVALAYAMMKVKTPIEVDTPLGTMRISNDYERRRAIMRVINNIPRMKRYALFELIKVLYECIGEDVHELYEKTMLTKDEIDELSEYGFEIGGHGDYHLGLPYLSEDELEREIELSKDFATRHNKSHNAYTFAYPFGLYDLKVVNMVRDKGLIAAVTMNPYLNDVSKLNLFELGRLPPYRFATFHLSTFKYQIIRG